MVILFVVTGSFRADLRKDEVFFWPAALHFTRHAIPTFEDLRTYPAPTTPLPFIVWGQFERWTGHGLVTGRALNAVLALATLALVLFNAGRGGRHQHAASGPHAVATSESGERAQSNLLRGILATLGVLACPYFLGAAVYLYTDIPAILLGTVGLALHLNARHGLSALFMALAIACRQYMIAFPAGILLWESIAAVSYGRLPTRSIIIPILTQFLAASTMLIWLAIFGGFAPKPALEQFNIPTDPVHILPRNALYFLACVGAYFVTVETILFRRVAIVRDIASTRTAVVAGVLALLFFKFPPLRNENYAIPAMGYLDRALRTLVPDIPRLAVLWLLASLAAARLARPNLAGFLVLANALILMKAHIGWDKYALPAIVALWLLAARDAIDEHQLFRCPDARQPAEKSLRAASW